MISIDRISTLVLNFDSSPLYHISGRKALLLMLRKKVTSIKFHKTPVRDTLGNLYLVPVVVKLTRMIRIGGPAPLTRINILIRDERKCRYCDVPLNLKTMTIDHVVPKCRGGKHAWNNVVASCFGCNNRKGNMTLKDTGMPEVIPVTPTAIEILLKKVS